MHLIHLRNRYYVCWTWNGKQHRWAAFPSRTLSHSWGRKLQDFLDHRRAHEKLPHALREWVRRLESKRLRELERLGLASAGDMGSESLDGMLEEFRRHLVALNRTPEHVRHTINQIRACVAGMHAVRLGDFDEGRVVQYMRDLRERLSAASVNHHLVSLKTFVAWSVRRGYIDYDPLIAVRRLNVAAEGVTMERRALTDREISTLLRFAKNIDRDRYWLYRFALETGLRRGEIRGLKIGNVDLRGGWAHVPAAYAKGKRLRSVPLSRRTCADLRVYWRGRKPDSSAFHLHHRTAEWLMMDMKAAGLNPHARGQVVDFHSLRHTYATKAGTKAESFADLMELMGHKTPQVTARYAHAEGKRLKRVAERLVQ